MRYFIYHGIYYPMVNGPRSRKRRVYKKWLKRKSVQAENARNLTIGWFGIYKFGPVWKTDGARMIRIDDCVNYDYKEGRE